MRIEITSGPYLHDILNKNPETDFGLYVKPHRNGYLIGNCLGGNAEKEYEVLFQDTKYSYGQEDNQIDFMSMCSPLVGLSVVGDFFGHLKSDFEMPWLGKKVSEVDTEPCSIFVPFIWIDSTWAKDGKFLLSRYIPEIQVEQQEVNLYSLKAEGRTVRDAINIFALTSLLIAISNNDEIYLTPDLCVKYAKILVKTNAPYFVYYLFLKRLGKNAFEAVKEILELGYEARFGVKATFTPNDTHTDRIRFVESQLDFDQAILDFGCGEFVYTKAIKKWKHLISYDRDDYSELYEKIKDRFKFRWDFTQDLSTVPDWISLEVVMSEVIEHNSEEAAKRIIEDLCRTKHVEKLVITTPNRDFNVHYGVEMRHDDHVFEFNYEEFKSFVEQLDIPLLQTVDIFEIGDRIGNHSVTLAAVLW